MSRVRRAVGLAPTERNGGDKPHRSLLPAVANDRARYDRRGHRGRIRPHDVRTHLFIVRGHRFEAAELPDHLTPRESEVLRLMAGGYSNREIADALGTSEGTVKNQASSVFSKLGVRDRTRAVFKAIELGWLTGRASGR